MTAPKLRSDSELLQLAQVQLKQTETRIDEAMERRRGLLLEGDANSLACINVDRELARLHALRLRLHAQIELRSRARPRVVSAPERSGWTWPSSLEDANAALAEIQPDLLRLRAIPRNDRHAGHDKAQDFLVQREYALLRLIESFAPRKMTAS